MDDVVLGVHARVGWEFGGSGTKRSYVFPIKCVSKITTYLLIMINLVYAVARCTNERGPTSFCARKCLACGCHLHLNVSLR